MAAAPSVQRQLMVRWRVAQFFELLWWKNYLSDKDKTEYLKWKTAYWRRFLEQGQIQLPAQGRILDAGCGPAGIFTVLQDHKVDAIDPLLDKYARDLPHFSQTDWPHVRFQQTTLEDFVPQQPYDAVFCLNAINHVHDLEQGFRQLAAATAPNGLLALSIDAHNHNLLKHLFRMVPGDILHPHQYDLEEYQKMMAQSGFTIQNAVLIKAERIFNYYLLVGIKKLA
jgi:2-polyprenyl-3-methyl-5-hydroxy-6-metoxy-1,4-benzoquinol methylase